MPFQKIAFIAGQSAESHDAQTRLTAQYGDCAPADADVIVPLGGDGLML